MKYINGNILDVEKGIIVHQVNCKNVMGSGLAKQIATKYPCVKSSYHCFCSEFNSKEKLLGRIIIVPVTRKLYIVNLFSQLEYGRDRNKVYTNYDAFNKGMRELVDSLKDKTQPIYIPYKIGCGLGNGNWDTIKEILNKIEKDYNIEFTIVKFEN